MFCRFSPIKTKKNEFVKKEKNISFSQNSEKYFAKNWIFIFGFGFYALHRVKKYITFTPKILLVYSLETFRDGKNQNLPQTDLFETQSFHT